MRSHFMFAALAVALIAAAPARAKDSGQKFKTVEPKHFDRAEGVELSADFNDYLYAELRSQLQKTKLFGQVIGEGEVVDDADAPASVVVSGTLTEYKKGSLAKNVLIGYGAGSRSLKAQVNLTRRSDQKTLVTVEVHVRASPRWSEKVLAQEAAKEMAKQIKNSLQHESAS
jgi:hypothetical protein